MQPSGGPMRSLSLPTTPPFGGRDGRAFVRIAFRRYPLASISNGFTHVPIRSADPIRAGIGVRPAEKMILYVGRVERIKGVHVLLEAVHDLPTDAKVGGVRWCNRARLRARTDAGWREHPFPWPAKCIPELMAAADLLVMPSDWLETQGLVVHESMASGTPVVASDIGGLTASMGGFPNQLVKPADPVAVQSNRALLVMARRRPGFGDRSREWVAAEMSIEMTADSVDSILSSAIDGGSDQRPGRPPDPDGLATLRRPTSG